MNYAASFLALILAFAWIFWIVSGKKYYSGPINETHEDVIIGASSEDHLRDDSTYKHSNA